VSPFRQYRSRQVTPQSTTANQLRNKPPRVEVGEANRENMVAEMRKGDVPGHDNGSAQ
jgi:hypothetical protein